MRPAYLQDLYHVYIKYVYIIYFDRYKQSAKRGY